MGAAENRELVRRWIEDGWNAGNTSSVMYDVYAADWIDGDSVQGPHGHEGVRQFVDVYTAAFPDLRFDILQLVADDDYVAVRWRAQGTHTGHLYGQPASNNAVSFTGHTLHRVVGGKLQESWLQVDTTGLFNQIGEK